MRGVLVTSMILAAGCGGDAKNPGGLPDAPGIDAASTTDAPRIDAPPACQPTPLLVAGTDIIKLQHWGVTAVAPDTLTNADGADFVELDTSTPKNAGSGGQLLLSLANAVPTTGPFKLEIVMKILSVTTPMSDPLDAPVAIMLAYNGGAGDMTERSQMLYVQATAVGYADGTGKPAALSLVDKAFHTFTLNVDANHKLTVAIDGQAQPTLDRTGMTINGTIAIGDQTNDAGFDSSIQIQSVTKLCL